MNMKTKERRFNSSQLAFKEIFVGTLIYAVVLGFFNDYTDIVHARSFSAIFYASMLLEVLTFMAFVIKGQVVKWLKQHSGIIYTVAMLFCVWLVMFLSKFVFIWSINFVFGDNVNINGFFGVLWVALSVTVVHGLVDYVFVKLGD